MTNNAKREFFVREDRYIVIKLKKLDEAQKYALSGWLTREEISTIDCVVVEHDWPEYEKVWQMIEARMTGQARAQASGVPVINIRCETVSDGIKGSTYLNVIGVEQEDDSSFTVVTDHWPKSASVPVERLEALRRQKCTVWDGESGAIDQWEDDINGDWVDWDDIVKLIAEYK